MFTPEQKEEIRQIVVETTLDVAGRPSTSILNELTELRHFKDTAVGLWCIDQDPKDKPIDWIRQNAFQLT